MKKLLLLLSLASSLAFAINRPIKSPTGTVQIGATVNVRASEGSGTTTLTMADSREQIFNLSAARIVKLATTGIKKGEKWGFKNVASGNFALTVQPSGATDTLAILNSTYAYAEVIALQDTPTTAAHWSVNFKYDGPQYLCDQSGGTNDITYNGAKATFSSNPAIGTGTVHRCILIPYQTLDGTWRLKLNIKWTSQTGAGAVYPSWSGITIKNVGSAVQAVIAYQVDSGAIYTTIARADPGAQSFTLSYSGSVSQPFVSADIELNSKPTWAY